MATLIPCNSPGDWVQSPDTDTNASRGESNPIGKITSLFLRALPWRQVFLNADERKELASVIDYGPNVEPYPVSPPVLRVVENLDSIDVASFAKCTPD